MSQSGSTPVRFDLLLLVSVLVIVTPGPDTAVITKHVLLSGRRGGFRSRGNSMRRLRNSRRWR